MALPHADEAVVEPRKLRDYLLSHAHPVGRFKAAFFASAGYSQDGWGTLSADLQAHAVTGDVIRVAATTFGTKYEVSGHLTGPNGKAVGVVSVWIILEGEDVPRFITAYPGARP